MITRRSFLSLSLVAPISQRLQAKPRDVKALVVGIGPLGANVQRIVQSSVDAEFWVWADDRSAQACGRARHYNFSVLRYSRPEADLKNGVVSCMIKEEIRRVPRSVDNAVIVGSLEDYTALLLLVPLWRYVIQHGIQTNLVLTVPALHATVEEKRRAARTLRSLNIIEPVSGYFTSPDGREFWREPTLERHLAKDVCDSLTPATAASFSQPLSVYFRQVNARPPNRTIPEAQRSVITDTTDY